MLSRPVEEKPMNLETSMQMNKSATSRVAAGSARSWPSSAGRTRRRRVERGQILFDHLWGIPGGAPRPAGGGNDLALLRIVIQCCRDIKAAHARFQNKQLPALHRC